MAPKIATAEMKGQSLGLFDPARLMASDLHKGQR